MCCLLLGNPIGSCQAGPCLGADACNKDTTFARRCAVDIRCDSILCGVDRNLGVRIKVVQDFGMRLQRHEHSFGGRHTSRARKAVRQRDLRWRSTLRLNFVFFGYFVWVLRLPISLCSLSCGVRDRRTIWPLIGGRTSEFAESFCGSVSTGLMQATPGEMKSFKSSADRMALIVTMRRTPAERLSGRDSGPAGGRD